MEFFVDNFECEALFYSKVMYGMLPSYFEYVKRYCAPVIVIPDRDNFS